jgi:hypothetical protein
MKSSLYFDVAGQLVASHPVGVLKIEIKTNASAASGFWQVHDSRTTPANTAVPIKSFPIGADEADYKEFKSGELRLVNGMYVCFSTTEATLTLGTGNNKFSALMVELSDPESPTGTTYTTAATSATTHTVWTHANGPKKLIRVFVTNLEATVHYLMLFADTASVGDKPIAQWKLFATGDSGGRDTLNLNFGESGLDVYALASSISKKKGCLLYLSSTPTILADATGLGMNIQAEYK